MNNPPSMTRISLIVKVPIVSIEVDHWPSALRKIPLLLGGEVWMARLVHDGGERRSLVMEWRAANENIVRPCPKKRKKLTEQSTKGEVRGSVLAGPLNP